MEMNGLGKIFWLCKKLKKTVNSKRTKLQKVTHTCNHDILPAKVVVKLCGSVFALIFHLKTFCRVTAHFTRHFHTIYLLISSRGKRVTKNVLTSMISENEIVSYGET